MILACVLPSVKVFAGSEGQRLTTPYYSFYINYFLHFTLIDFYINNGTILSFSCDGRHFFFGIFFGFGKNQLRKSGSGDEAYVGLIPSLKPLSLLQVFGLTVQKLGRPDGYTDGQ